MKIGIAGLAGAGKDETALLLKRILEGAGFKVSIDRFAYPLKVASAAIFGLEGERRENKERVLPVRTGVFNFAIARLARTMGRADEFDEWLHHAQDVFLPHMQDGVYMLSPRLFQTLVGTELRHALGLPNMYRDRIADIKVGPDEILIVPDVRYVDEASIMTALVFVNRPELGIPELDSAHSSEHLAAYIARHLPSSIPDERCGVWYIATNDGTLKDLGEEISCLYSTMCGEWPGLRKPPATPTA